MEIRFARIPKIITWLYPKRIWSIKNQKNTVYLTFDDGPTPNVTPWVLDQLKKHGVKATFFCIGKNIQKHPAIFQKIISEGHQVGNHTFDHLNGWKTATTEYVENVLHHEETINSKFNNRISSIVNRTSLFRPPYGKITSAQAKTLQKEGHKIVMWDVLSYDFDTTISEEKCLQNVLKNISSGSIVVFHDSLKAEKNLRYVLPKILYFIDKKGWKAISIQNSEI